MNSPMLSGVTRIIYAFCPMLAWFFSQYIWKDITVMKHTNHYYYEGWQVFWIGNLSMFTLPGILYIASAFSDNVKVKFAFKFFC